MNPGQNKYFQYRKILFVILLAAMVLAFSIVSFRWKWQGSISFVDMLGLTEVTHFEYVEVSSCQVGLDGMLTGHWQMKNYTAKELEEVEIFLARTRAYHKLPPSLEREDKKCGNVNFPGTNWHRAVCNPKGPTPCCMNNFCVNKSVHECQCPECLDMRSQIHAELATWVPKDQNCTVGRHFQRKSLSHKS